MKRRTMLGGLLAAPLGAKQAVEMATKNLAGLGQAGRSSLDYVGPMPGVGYAEKAAEAVWDKAARINRLKDLIAGKGDDFERWQRNQTDASADNYQRYEALRSVSQAGRRYMIRQASYRYWLERHRNDWMAELKELLG